MKLTDEQIEQVARNHGTGGWQSLEDMKRFARAILAASKSAAPEGWKLAMVERSYDMRAKAIIAFNTAEQSGKDRDDALDAAWQAMLAASPAAPAQSVEAVTLPIMRVAFRVTETEGDTNPNKQRFHMRFTFRSMDDLHAADNQWRAFVWQSKKADGL